MIIYTLNMDTKEDENSFFHEICVNEIINNPSKIEEENLRTSVLCKDIYRSNNFSVVLSKIDEVDESPVKSPLSNDVDLKRITSGDKENMEVKDKSPHVVWKSEDEIIDIDNKSFKTKQRPKSANYVDSKITKDGNKICSQRCGKIVSRSVLKSNHSRNSDSESNSESSFVSVLGRPRSAGSKPKNQIWHENCAWDSYYCPSRPTSACGMVNYYGDCCQQEKEIWTHCNSNLGRWQPRKCKSNPNITRSKLNNSHNPDLQIERFKRSLKLLGLEVADFGILDNGSEASKYGITKRRGKKVESTFSTKIVKRSISLDGLKAEVREAWLDDRLDSSHRKLLAQAAYEEWYFKKEEELHRKLENEKIKNKKMKEKLEDEFKSRKLKAEEQFQKWVENKKKILKRKKTSEMSTLAQFKVEKTREEVDVAYRRWKKDKDKQREKKHKIELLEKERKVDEEKQKEEKKVMAEKAFNEWMRKLKETEKILAEARLKKEKRKEEMEKRKKEQKKKTSFQTWKDMKDKELMMKKLENRNAERIARALRSAQLEERMYEAEQSFEEWLEKLEMRENVLMSKKTVS